MNSTRALVDTLDFVTAAGNMTALITPIAVFEREPATGQRFHLVWYRPDVTVAQIQEQTGFRFDAGSAAVAAPPSGRELSALDALDINAQFSGPVNH